MRHTLKTAHDLLTFLLLPLCTFVQALLQAILNLVFAPRKQDIHSNNVTCYHVLVNLKMHFAWPNGTDKFLLKFTKTEDISVIEQDNVFLAGVKENEFHFIRTKPGVRVTDMELYPLIYFSLFDHAVEVLVVPHMTVFQYLRDKPDRDGRNITLLHNIGRCGSTLVAHMVYRTKQCKVLSEPFPLLQSIVLTNKLHGLENEDKKQDFSILRATLLLLCKDPGERYFIKVTGVYTGNSVQLIHKVLPKIKDLFLYRALVPTVQSFRRILGKIYFPTVGWDVSLSRLPRKYTRIWEKIKVPGLAERWLFVMLCQMHPYYLEAEERQDMKSYSYESILSDGEGFCKSLLKEIGVGEEYVPVALSALEKDSQANTPISRKTGDVTRGCLISREAREWAVRVAWEEFGMKMEEENCRVTNVPLPWSSSSECNG